MSYGSFVVMRDIEFDVARKDIFVIMGGSGCGKSTLLRHLIGLLEPTAGSIHYGDENFTTATPEQRKRMIRRFGVMYQSGALFGSMTLLENVRLPLEVYTGLPDDAIDLVARMKLELVGLEAFTGHLPAELSGGMQKRAGLARAVVAQPEILFFDEPTTGLDPITAAAINELISNQVRRLGSTAVSITHDLASAQTIGDEIAMLHGGKIIWRGPAAELHTTDNPYVRQFVEGRAEGPISHSV